ncbi:MAG: GDP-mannose 4,6-dehydratase, partial [Ignavibacteriaceae bacterium]|nr:GDP-mannose 4,6-dehydratase [Ignavibacteriaceae bacterium]
GDEMIEYVKDRPGHDRRYAIDNTKIETDLGWTPEFSFESAIGETIDWYLNNKEWWQRIISGEYEKYYSQLYGKR